MSFCKDYTQHPQLENVTSLKKKATISSFFVEYIKSPSALLYNTNSVKPSTVHSENTAL